MYLGRQWMMDQMQDLGGVANCGSRLGGEWADEKSASRSFSTFQINKCNLVIVTKNSILKL